MTVQLISGFDLACLVYDALAAHDRPMSRAEIAAYVAQSGITITDNDVCAGLAYGGLAEKACQGKLPGRPRPITKHGTVYASGYALGELGSSLSEPTAQVPAAGRAIGARGEH